MTSRNKDRVLNPTLRKLEAVFSACDQLEKMNPGNWGQNDLHRLVGGSLETLVPLRQLWLKQKKLRDEAPSTAAMLLMAMASTVNGMVEEFQDTLTVTVASLKDDHEEAFSELLSSYETISQRNAVLEEELASTHNRVCQLKTEIDSLSRDYHTCQEALAKLHLSLAAKESSLSQSLADNNRLEYQVTTLETRLKERDGQHLDNQANIASLQSRIELMADSHQGAVEQLQNNHRRELETLKQEHKVTMSELRQEEREAAKGAIADIKDVHRTEMALLIQQRDSAESALREILATTQQRAATAEGQTTLLERQLEEAQRRTDAAKTQMARTIHEDNAAIDFALGCEEKGDGLAFLTLWRQGDNQGIKKTFPGFRL